MTWTAEHRRAADRRDLQYSGGPVQQRIAHGTGDLVDRGIRHCGIEQPGLLFVERQAAGFNLEGQFRYLESGKGRGIGGKAATRCSTGTGPPE